MPVEDPQSVIFSSNSASRAAIITKADCSRPVIIMAAVIIVNATVSYSSTESTTVAIPPSNSALEVRAYGLHYPQCTIKATVKSMQEAK